MPSRLTVAATVLGAAIVAALVAAVVVVAGQQASSQAAPRPRSGVVPGTQASPPAMPAGAVTQQRPPRAAVRHAHLDPPARRLATFWGIDVSWPQCDPGALPALQTGFVTVGVNDGRPFTDNPCAHQQVAYARGHTGYAAYLNIDAPRGGDPASYGRRVALDGLARAAADGLRPPSLWLDVEVLNHWADPTTNVAVINAAVRALQRHGVTAGIYSSVPMWQQITGGAQVGVPVWLATTVTDYRAVDPLCVTGLGGHPAVLAQYVAATGSRLIDVDVLCSATRAQSVPLFAAGHGG